jgi:hypothetical protein
MDAPSVSVPWYIDQIEVVVTVCIAVLTGVYYGARWTGRIEHVVEVGFTKNTAEHDEIKDTQRGLNETVQQHAERLARAEAEIADHRTRYP